jgi:hypothetical protein
VLDFAQSISLTLGWPNVTFSAVDGDIEAYHVLLRQKVTLAVTAQLKAANSSTRTF